MPEPTGKEAWLIEAIATGDLERVQPNMGAAGHRITEARSHVISARTLAASDPTLAMAACHDAIRKAITAYLTAMGLRARGGEGAHRIVLAYARHQLADVLSVDQLTAGEDIRRDRAVAEYGDFAARRFQASHILWAAGIAEAFVTAIASALAALSSRSKHE